MVPSKASDEKRTIAVAALAPTSIQRHHKVPLNEKMKGFTGSLHVNARIVPGLAGSPPVEALVG
jgi:hypothetical protein